MDRARAAQRHLSRVDPVFAGIIRTVGPLPEPRRAGPLLPAIARTVVGQQLSVAAAGTIWKRVLAVCGGRLTAQSLGRLDHEALRACGCSGAKARALLSLAERASRGPLVPQLRSLDAAAARAALVALPGLGPWSAEMLLMFHCGFDDVFSSGDAGLRRAMQLAYGFERQAWDQAWPSISAPWAPWRSWACRWLWRWIDAVPT